MKLQDHETRTLRGLQPGASICIWRIDEPQWRDGRVYTEDVIGQITVLSVMRIAIGAIKLKDIKRGGRVYVELMEELRAIGGEELMSVWEIRLAKGDLSGKPRLLKHAGGRAGTASFDYIDQPGNRQMKGEPEALTDEQLLEIESRNKKEREERVAEFKRRTVEEATTLFRGEDALRNFTRVTDSLGKKSTG